METNWLILLVGLIALTALIVFFVIRNQKVKKMLMQELIQKNDGFIPAEHDTIVNPAD